MKQNKFFKIVIVVLCICFIILCLRPNVMSQISKWQVAGLNRVPEIDGFYPEWEWWEALEVGALSLDYKEEYLKDDILSVSLHFYDNSNDVRINTMVNISESDKVRMNLRMFYDYEEKKLIYRPVSIYIEEPNDSERYLDEKSIDECLNKYGLTRQDVKAYQEYVIYDVIVRTWTKAHITQWYWLESWKLKLCKVEDDTFRFEEE